MRFLARKWQYHLSLPEFYLRNHAPVSEFFTCIKLEVQGFSYQIAEQAQYKSGWVKTGVRAGTA